MLDADTKRRIDTARDILVGKVPDPKSQVEQITIALIYKFMNDMDTEAEELGGKRKFFADDFVRYAWPKLMHSGLGGFEVLNLYAEAIAKMTENPGIPPLFRDIFKNAYLPYRDPETLKSFLKVIDEFKYDHSEKLGDAFEYLLSVLGSQGDAGQFRTPRHIIDFIVRIVDPKKTDSILDPACGTAGFLISAYKHIVRQNTDENGNVTLTPDEKGRIAQHLKGYDISPDMVRLSLVNLYLHGFTDPHIDEYDTLTSEDKWNELADVILANPPFMSPKGGIKPHRKFSVQSKRSEVLFVDYMAEHLTPNGRAGIIVPEGVVFQSGGAYKELRKMLVEQYLVAVISLPAGVFNPYSGVKTSILILDRGLAKQSDVIGFFKISNDGFGLGAQRRQIEKNDLPLCASEIESFIENLRARATITDDAFSTGLPVPRARIAENGDYNLSGERYRENGIQHSIYALRTFDSVCTLEYGASLPKEKRVEGPYPVVGSNGITGYHNEFLVKGPTIVVGRKGSAGEVTFIKEDCFPIDTTYYVKQVDPGESDLVFLYWMLKSLNLATLRDGAGIPGLNRSDVYGAYKLPLPPLDVQKEIVAEIEGYQKIIDGARAVVENYRPHIPIDPDWPLKKLGEICAFKNGLNYHRNATGSVIRIVGVKDFQANIFAQVESLDEVTIDGDLSDDYLLQVGDMLFVRSNGNPDLVGRSIMIPEVRGKMSFSGFTIRARFDPTVAHPLFYAFLFKGEALSTVMKSTGRGANIRNLSQEILKDVVVPLPPLEAQYLIAAEIEAEQSLVAVTKELITRFEKKIQDTIARVWGEDKTPVEAH